MNTPNPPQSPYPHREIALVVLGLDLLNNALQSITEKPIGLCTCREGEPHCEACQLANVVHHAEGILYSTARFSAAIFCDCKRAKLGKAGVRLRSYLLSRLVKASAERIAGAVLAVLRKKKPAVQNRIAGSLAMTMLNPSAN